MEIILLRHGKTAGNLKHRYIGTTNEPLSREGILGLAKLGVFPNIKEVYVSPLDRTQETAAIVFPNARQIVCNDLREMNFGDFENKSARDMTNDPAYRKWVESGCISPCPNGESYDQFTERSCNAFFDLINEGIAQEKKRIILIIHGGSIMSIMNRFAQPERPFFEWQVKHGSGYRSKVIEKTWQLHPKLYECFQIKKLNL